MRFRTLEIRWHDSKPIASCDFQPVPSFKKARPSGLGSPDVSLQEWTERWAGQSYKLATGGEDNHVRIWMVHPNIRPTTSAAEPSTSSTQTAPRPPRVEYLATLSRHSAAVNVVRWSPNGELLASAGDDGMIIIWAQSSTPQATTYGSDLAPEELLNEKEFWKVRIMVRCTTMQVYDLAWSPTGEYIIAGSTDNAARVFRAADGKCVHELADHTHFVQGVSWDPLNEFIATQSSDKTMHVHRVTHNNQSGALEVHAVGKNSHMNMNFGAHNSLGSSRQGRSQSRKHRRNLSVVSNTSHTEGQRETSRPRISRRESATSDVESVFEESGSALFSNATPAPAMGGSAEVKESREFKDPTPLSLSLPLPLTPSTSVASTPVLPPSASLSGGPPSTASSLPAISTALPSSSSTMFPPPATPVEKEKSGQPSSRRSSFSGASNAGGPASPAPSAFSVGSRFGRSPSPMPALPAIRTALPTSYPYSTPHAGSNQWRGTDQWRNVGLYGDENFTNFFRRLTFSPDGALLVTPAGQFEDPEVVIVPTPSLEEGGSTPIRGRTGRVEDSPSGSSGAVATTTKLSGGTAGTSSCVYIYTRANFARPPIATLPGHKKASVAVRFSPILVDLREGVSGLDSGSSTLPVSNDTPEKAVVEKELVELDVDVLGPLPTSSAPSAVMGMTLLPGSQQQRPPSSHGGGGAIASPVPRPPSSGESNARPPTPAASKPGTPNPQGSRISTTTTTSGSTAASVFALPYRMFFAVVTMDAVVIYDTQQSTPVCMLTKLHYDEFTDASWSPDGQTLILSSRDGYCTLIVFDEIFPAYHTQQQALQLQSIAHQHSVPITPTPSSGHHHSHSHTASASSRAGTPSATPVFGNVGLPPVGNPAPSPAPMARRNTSTGSTSGSNIEPQPPTPTASTDSETRSFVFPGPQPGEPLKREREEGENDGAQASDDTSEKLQEPPKKKRRVALTRVGDLGS